MSDLDVASLGSSSSEEYCTPIKTQHDPIVISSDEEECEELLEELLKQDLKKIPLLQCYSCGNDEVPAPQTKACDLCTNSSCIDTCYATHGHVDICTRCWYKGGERDRMCRDIDPADYKRIKKLEKIINKGHFPPRFPYATQRVKDENNKSHG